MRRFGQLHLTPTERKQWNIKGGDGLQVFETEKGTVAIPAVFRHIQPSTQYKNVILFESVKQASHTLLGNSVKGWFVMLYSPQLITRKIAPENQEFPIFSIASWITPEHLFFIRNHFMYPVIDMRSWYISIEGCVNKPYHFTYQNLIRMPQITLPVTLECAGDKRALFHPKTRGEQWELGAISHAVWTGVPLKVVLDYCGIQQNAVEVVFEAMDADDK